MTRIKTMALVVVLSLLVIVGCASLKPTKLTDAKGSCYSYTGTNDDAVRGGPAKGLRSIPEGIGPNA